LQRELRKLGSKLQELFPKFFYKQKVVEEMIVVAGNVHEKSRQPAPHSELEALRTRRTPGAIEAERAKSRRLSNSCGCRARFFTDIQRFAGRRRTRAESQNAHGRGQPCASSFPVAKKYTNRGQSFSIDPGRQHRLDEGVEKFEYRRGYKFPPMHLVDRQPLRAASPPARTIRIPVI